jgi:hypothetical protein
MQSSFGHPRKSFGQPAAAAAEEEEEEEEEFTIVAARGSSNFIQICNNKSLKSIGSPL